MKRKKILCTAVAACMALGCVVGPAGAVDTEKAAIIQSADSRAVTPSTNVVLNEGQSSQLITWPVYNGYGYWKIMIRNLSASTTRVKIRKGSPTGAQVGSTMVIPAGQQMSFYCEEDSPLATGAYYLDITTDGENNLKGNLYYKFATNYDDVL